MFLYIAMILAGIAFIAFFMYQQKKLVGSEAYSKKILDFFKQLEGFNLSYALLGVRDPSGNTRAMAIDATSETLCLYDRNDALEYRLIDYSDVLSTEIFENGISISYFSSDTKILKFNFEKELAEGDKTIFSLSAECSFGNGDEDLFRVYTISSSTPVDANEYRLKKEEINKWHHLMIKIIERNKPSLKRID